MSLALPSAGVSAAGVAGAVSATGAGFAFGAGAVSAGAL